MLALKRFAGSIAVFGLVMALVILLGRGHASSDPHHMPEPVTVTAYPVATFKPEDQVKIAGNSLTFLGGLELRGKHPNFGGISAIRMDDTGERFLALTDQGDWIDGRLVTRGGRPESVADVTIAPILGPDGRRLKDQGLWDSESLARAGGSVFIGIERQHSVFRFDLTRDGLKARGQRVPIPLFASTWPRNAGIEALGILPQGSAYAGRLIAFSERSGNDTEPTEGFVMRQDGGEPFRILLKRVDRFDITDLDFLPNGDLVVLERFFRPVRGVSMRIRRVKLGDIKPEALLEGEELVRIGPGPAIDNMEGLSIHRNNAGETIFTLISDDNFSVVQRTLLLQFRWSGD